MSDADGPDADGPDDDGSDGPDDDGSDGPDDDSPSDPTGIRQLDERTIQRIAAGEVVERPASVVKELVENSLDAGASRVSVAVERGGTEGIRVRDDGAGVPRDQLADAVAEHATSKIADIEDLEAGVGTLGFRGEALYTIGAVSELTVRSRPRPEAHAGLDPADAGAGAEITVEGGEVGDVKPAGCPEGTTVEVERLFYNTPAREKFLKTVATEFDHVNTVVTGYALANPDVAVSLEHDGREVFATEGSGDLRSAVLSVYGREVAEAMVDVDWTPGDGDIATADGDDDAATGDGNDDGDGDDDAATGDDDSDNRTNEGTDDTPVLRVHGLISHPETTRASREYLATYVNDRYVTATTLRNAVVDAYGGQLAPDRYPFAVLFVDVPAGSIDVNVHPRKTEVRFDDEAAVRDAVETAVEGALLDHGLVRSTAPRGRSAPDETRVAPEPDAGETVGGAGTDHERAAADSRDASRDAADSDDPTAASELAPDDEDAWAVDGLGGDGDAGSFARDTDTDADTDPSFAGDTPTDSPDKPGGATDSGGGLPDHNTAHTDRERPSPREWQSPEREDAGTDDTTSTDGADDTAEVDQAGATGADRRPASSVRRADATSQRTLAGDAATAERAYDSLPSLRVLGQLHDTYVVAESPDGLVLIDQHAADERVNYERLQKEFDGGAAAQSLADPVPVELTAREAALFAEFADDLRGIGFRAERDGERAVRVTAVPAVFDATLDPALLRDVLGAFVSDAADGEEPVADVVDELLADLACYPSVTGNTSLTEGSVVDLLAALDDCENPYACPHGRPVVIAFDRSEIGDRFERDYPGHAGRREE